MREDDINKMITFLCKKATSTAVELITMALTLYYLCGRAGELGLLSLSNILWKNNAIFLLLPNLKTQKEQLLDVYPHYNNPLIDLFFWIATYLMCFPSLSTSQNEMGWLFPRLRAFYEDEDGGNGTSGSVSNAVTSLLDKLLTNEANSKACTSHAFRHGASDDLIMSQAARDNCSVLIGAIFRGGWDFAGDCQIFDYLFKALFMTQAGKAQTGHPNARMDVAMPSLQPIIDVCTNDENGMNYCYDILDQI